ncbi:hypothetical protein ACL02O_20845 [Micromonospora sp. MS34]|uniref:hypothetical protein n=1 Tax=Micromonospora sp. MS34 TaxID=3385971 RepID=UPI00399FE5F7
MTTAPQNLLAVRSLLLTHLNVDKNTVRASDLEPGEVGIVGDANHLGGYHCGSDRVVAHDYSVVESTRDSSGLTLNASALDVGMFSVVSGGRTHDLRTFSVWFVAQCAAGAADTRDIREIIYSPDGKTVKRWDRLGKRTSGDSSHLTHTHFSFFRDSTKVGRDQTPLFRRYLTTIGLIEEADMTPEQDARLKHIETMLTRPDGRETVGMLYLRLAVGKDDMPDAKPVTHPTLTSLGGQLAALRADIAALAAKDLVNEQEVAAQVAPAVLAVLTPEAIAGAIPPQIAKDVADEIARRMVA